MPFFMKQKLITGLECFKVNFDLNDILRQLHSGKLEFLNFAEDYLKEYHNEKNYLYVEKILKKEECLPENGRITNEDNLCEYIELDDAIYNFINAMPCEDEAKKELYCYCFGIYFFAKISPDQFPISIAPSYDNEAKKNNIHKLEGNPIFLDSSTTDAFMVFKGTDKEKYEIETKKIINKKSRATTIEFRDEDNVFLNYALQPDEYIYVNTIDDLFVKLIPTMSLGNNYHLIREDLAFSDISLANNETGEKIHINGISSAINFAISYSDGFLAILENGLLKKQFNPNLGNAFDSINMLFSEEFFVDVAVYDNLFILLLKDGYVLSNINDFNECENIVAVGFEPDGKGFCIKKDDPQIYKTYSSKWILKELKIDAEALGLNEFSDFICYKSKILIRKNQSATLNKIN